MSNSRVFGNGYIQLGSERIRAVLDVTVDQERLETTCFGSTTRSFIPGPVTTTVRLTLPAGDAHRVQSLFDDRLLIAINGTEMVAADARLSRVDINTASGAYGELTFTCARMAQPDLRERTKAFREANL